MSSPFSGMDPYLESYLWPDVHHRLATEICRQLMPRLMPRYVARLEISVIEDTAPEAEIGVMYPDVEVLTTDEATDPIAQSWGGQTAGGLSPTPALVTVELANPQVSIATVEIRTVAQNQLITAIEILSPINKREPGLTAYRRKRERLRQAEVHLLEIDLLRRGARWLTHPRVPETAYRALLVRARQDRVELWPIRLADPLPVLPVPLREVDPDVPLDLPSALATIYTEAAYQLSINYHQSPPPPSLSEAEANWLDQVLRQAGKR